MQASVYIYIFTGYSAVFFINLLLEVTTFKRKKNSEDPTLKCSIFQAVQNAAYYRGKRPQFRTSHQGGGELYFISLNVARLLVLHLSICHSCATPSWNCVQENSSFNCKIGGQLLFFLGGNQKNWLDQSGFSQNWLTRPIQSLSCDVRLSCFVHKPRFKNEICLKVPKKFQ